MSQRYKGAIISATPPTTSTSSASGEWTLAQQAQAQGASAWPVANPDPYFNQVSLLLHGDGTNGGQNNTFLDSSPPGGYSVYFDGNGDYLSTSPIGAISGDFTIEFWAYKSANGAIGYDGVCAEQTGTTVKWYLELSSNAGFWLVNKAGGNTACINNTTTGINDNAWHHWAVCRSGSNWYMFKDGVSLTLTTNTIGTASLAAGTSFVVGVEIDFSAVAFFNGTISNFRIVKGTALYTSNFTPYYGNLTAVTGTQLLTCQGPNIVDNSPNAFPITVNGGATVASPVTITRNGNTTQGTFTPFSQAAGYWSNYFDGTGDYLSSPITSMNIRTDSFTIESWCYLTTTTKFILFCGSTTTSPGNDLYLGESGGTIYFGSLSSGINIITFSSSLLPLNQWFHCACTFDGTTYRVFINGVSVGSSTTLFGSYTLISITIAFRNYDTGFYLAGYLSNFRIVKGTAVYTSNFTPSTTPLTAITNTSLLTCQSNRFIDNSANNFTITPAGDTKVTAWSPFIPALTPYSTSTNGGSGYFDGSGDYLSAPDSTSLRVLGSSFTIECWFYLTATSPADMGLISKYDAGGSGYILRLLSTGTGIRWFAGTGGAVLMDRTYAFSLNTWYHVAVTCDGTNTAIFVNGVKQGASGGVTSDNSTATFQVGLTHTVTNYFPGYISNVRVVKGTDVYGVGNSSFTVPTAPLTAISGTSLLLNCTNAAIYDNAIKNDVETVGNAQISTSVKKYGTGSMYFDGTGDYLINQGNIDSFTFGTGDFTIEGWFNFSSLVSGGTFIDFRPFGGTGAYPVISYNSTYGITYFVNNSNVINSNLTPTVGTWYHIVISRSGSSTKMFINGVQYGSTWTDTTDYIVGGRGPVIGANAFNTSLAFNGYIDDLRITKGVARYTANFVPPIQAFPDY